MKKPIKRVDVKDVPEVVEFLDAQKAIEEFKEEHAEILEQLADLSERYNTALEQADKVCRSNGVGCGPFDLYQISTKYDAEKLYNAIGRDKFLEAGGKIETVTAFSVDRGRLEAVIAKNLLPEAVVEAVRTESPAYHKPKPLVVP